MTRLTEEMVIARSKQSDLSAIKKLNCWGAELTDVSILIRMVNVEVLALSINKIRTLIDFQHCRRLKELYVRKNRLTDLSEVRHLRALPALRVLWLGENPCAEQPNYRLTVLRALPRLEKLDNINVESEEVEEAARKGNPIHSDGEEDSEPELDNYTNQYWSKNDDSTDRDDYRNGDQEQTTYTSRPSAVMRSPPATTNGGRSSQDYDNGPANHGHGRPSALPRSPPNGTTYIQTSPVRQRCYSPEPVEETRYEQPPQRSQYFEESSPMNGDHGREGRYHPQHHSARHSVVSPHAECYYDRYASQNLEPQAPAPYNGGAPPREREREREAWERDSVTSTQIASNVMADHRGFTRRPMTRNSNLLSAVLCLVKELDYTSLEVAEMAVRCRMDELANRP